MKKQILKYCSILALMFSLTFSTVNTVEAQCPMCRMAAESNLKDGGNAGKGLNAGILWRNNRKQEEDEPVIIRGNKMLDN